MYIFRPTSPIFNKPINFLYITKIDSFLTFPIFLNPYINTYLYFKWQLDTYYSIANFTHTVLSTYSYNPIDTTTIFMCSIFIFFIVIKSAVVFIIRVVVISGRFVSIFGLWLWVGLIVCVRVRWWICGGWRSSGRVWIGCLCFRILFIGAVFVILCVSSMRLTVCFRMILFSSLLLSCGISSSLCSSSHVSFSYHSLIFHVFPSFTLYYLHTF